MLAGSWLVGDARFVSWSCLCFFGWWLLVLGFWIVGWCLFRPSWRPPSLSSHPTITWPRAIRASRNDNHSNISKNSCLHVLAVASICVRLLAFAYVPLDGLVVKKRFGIQRKLKCLNPALPSDQSSPAINLDKRHRSPAMVHDKPWLNSGNSYKHYRITIRFDEYVHMSFIFVPTSFLFRLQSKSNEIHRNQTEYMQMWNFDKRTPPNHVNTLRRTDALVKVPHPAKKRPMHEVCDFSFA